jgi:hypothetical protein
MANSQVPRSWRAVASWPGNQLLFPALPMTDGLSAAGGGPFGLLKGAQ